MTRVARRGHRAGRVFVVHAVGDDRRGEPEGHRRCRHRRHGPGGHPAAVPQRANPELPTNLLTPPATNCKLAFL